MAYDFIHFTTSFTPSLTIAFLSLFSCQGKLVYANYGRDQDFEALEKMGVNCSGKIVIMRYGKIGRSGKVSTAPDFTKVNLKKRVILLKQKANWVVSISIYNTSECVFRALIGYLLTEKWSPRANFYSHLSENVRGWLFSCVVGIY